MWDVVVKILSMVHEDGHNIILVEQVVWFTKWRASIFFNMKLMLKELQFSDDLSLLLQWKDQNIF
jgi:hypothetical protein